MPAHVSRRAGLIASAAAAAAASVSSALAGAAPPECFDALRSHSGPRLVCEHHAWMTEQERADLERLTRGYLKNARCVVSVDIERRLVDEALAASDRTFDAPPQPVVCALETSSGPLTIGGTFAPHVEFKGGFAVAASPGLGNITGVNSYLAWPVVMYVNRSAAITGEMARMIDAIRTALTHRREAAR